MQQRVDLGASQSQITMSAGASPVAVTLTLSNRSQVVDQFDLSVEGGEADWYEIAPARVSLFPGESATVTLRVHPPRRESVLAGQYNLVVRATSRDDASLAAAGIVLTITPSGGFRLEMVKARDSGRQGTFSLRAVNLSDAPLVLNLSAQDPETALVFYFPAVAIQLNAYEDKPVSFNVRAKRQPMSGEPVVYQFTVAAEPQLADRTQAARDAQRVAGEFIYRPRIRRYPWASLPKLVSFAIPATGAVAALTAVLVASGAIGGNNDPTPTPQVLPNVDATLAARDLAGSATAASLALSRTPTPSLTPSATTTGTVVPTTTETPSRTPTITRTPTRTLTPTITRTPTRTPTPRIFFPDPRFPGPILIPSIVLGP